VALRHPILAGNMRLQRAAAGPPSVKPQPALEDPDAVRRIQQALAQLGFFADGADLPGVFGSGTSAAVVAFQQSAFPADSSQWDGFVGRNTLARLDARLLAGPGPRPGPLPSADEVAQTMSAEDTQPVTFGYRIVEPSSVTRVDPDSGNLVPFDTVTPKVPIRRLMYRITRQGKIYWVGAAVPTTVEAFDEAQVFFHPAPGQAGLSDRDYPTFAGGWDNVYRYVPWLGSQLAESGRKQVLLVPFMAGHMYATLGFLAGDPVGRIAELLGIVRSTVTGDATPPTVRAIGAASFSVGISALATFARQAAPSGLLTDLTDFDGLYSNSPHKHFSGAGGAVFRRYMQGGLRPGGLRVYSAPGPRWSAYSPPPRTGNDVHALMPNLFLHAMSWLA